MIFAMDKHPNGIALRLMELITANLDLRSDELNRAYFACAGAINRELANVRRKSLRLIRTEHASLDDLGDAK